MRRQQEGQIAVLQDQPVVAEREAHASPRVKLARQVARVGRHGMPFEESARVRLEQALRRLSDCVGRSEGGEQPHRGQAGKKCRRGGGKMGGVMRVPSNAE